MTSPLAVHGLSKHFSGARALHRVSFEIEPGSVTALLGQNGSGKSTLIKILAGFHAADEGDVVVNGESLGPSPAAKVVFNQGLRFVHQDLGLIEGLSVADNFGLSHGYVTTRSGRIDKEIAAARTREALQSVGVGVGPSALVGDLPPTERTLVAIARAIAGVSHDAQHNPCILVLDEPTAALPAGSVDQVLELLDRVRQYGHSVLFVTHRLDEVVRIADHLVVLRDGEVVTSEPRGAHDSNTLANMIVGADTSRARTIHDRRAPGEVSVRVENLSGRKLNDVSFEIRIGEVLGVAGLLGCGRSELARIIAGVQQPSAGRMVIESVDYAPRNPREALSNGIAYAPADRRAQGCVLDMSVLQNITLGDLSRHTRMGMIDHRGERHEVLDLIRAFDIRPPRPEQQIRTLSGGNQQKAVIAKFVRLNPRLLVVDEPTQGVDIGGKKEILQILQRHTEHGGSVLLASSDYDEIAAVCHRVLVLDRGRLVGIFDSSEISEKRLAVLSTKGEQRESE